MRLLIITQVVDPRHPILGFFAGWLRHIAPLVDRVEVICSELRVDDIAPNLRLWSLGKEDGLGRAQRLHRFHRFASELVLRRQVDVILAHMCPEFVLAIAPYAARRRVPIVLWYAHRQASWQLHLAHRLVTRIVTSAPSSFPFPSRKVTAIGQGIDVHHFAPAENGQSQAERPRLVVAGRLAAVKRLELIMEAAAWLIRRQHHPVRLALVGDGDRRRAQRAARRHRLEPYLEWRGAVPYDRMPAEYHRASLLVNASPPGLFDKVVLEAMACGRPAVVTNPAFAPLLGCDGEALFARDARPAGLAHTIVRALDHAAEDPDVRQRLRTAVIREHHVAAFVARLLQGINDACS